MHARREDTLSEAEQVARRAQVRTIDEMMRLLEALPDRFAACYEASCGYRHYHDLLSPIAAQVTMAHPGQLRLIFRSKDTNDRKDAFQSPRPDGYQAIGRIDPRLHKQNNSLGFGGNRAPEYLADPSPFLQTDPAN